jgi:hypothetical protein
VPGKKTSNCVKPTMMHIARVVGVEMSAQKFTIKEADRDGGKEFLQFYF